MDDIQAPDTGLSNGRGRMSNFYTAGEWFMPVLFIKYIEKFGLTFDVPEDEVKKWLKDVVPPILKQIFSPLFEIVPSVCGSNNKEDNK